MKIDADRDYDDFERWFDGLADIVFADLAFTWMETLKAGAVLSRGGYDSFKGWLFDEKWPGIRMAREIDRLTSLADYARWAA